MPITDAANARKYRLVYIPHPIDPTINPARIVTITTYRKSIANLDDDGFIFLSFLAQGADGFK